MKCIAVLLFAYFGYVRCHSWIACSDYMEKNGADWDASKCRGFPRDSSKYADKNSFGQDRGFDYQPGVNGRGCKTTYSGSSYSSNYPKAVYYPGQQVIIVHPMKNHGADVKCTNKYIPDNGNRLYRGRVNTDRDRSRSEYEQRLVADLGVSRVGFNVGDEETSTYPKPGYQNAPNFCKNTDKAMGTYSFNVPTKLAEGDYTFMWKWAFNGPDNVYTTCFDVIVTQNKAARDQMLEDRSFKLDVACGGRTSDNSAGSTAGCGGSPVTQPPRTTTQAPRTTSTTRRTTIPPRPTLPPASGTQAIVQLYQMSGEIALDLVGNGISRRYVTIYFDCPVHANFWNARLLKSYPEASQKPDEISIFELLQDQGDHIASRKIFFTATYDEACGIIADPPYATIIKDE